MPSPPPADALPRAILALARRVHAEGGAAHHVASPLGAWLLLALGASATTGAARAEAEAILGVDGGTALELAKGLLEHPHPAVATAAALWCCQEPRSAAMDAWASSLGDRVARGPIPSQEAADAWARSATDGMIARFPARVRDLDVILATAFATRSRWEEPYLTMPGSALVDPHRAPSATWGRGLTTILRDLSEGAARIVRSREAGDVVVHQRRGGDGLVVTSVRALPDIPPDRVLAAAYEIAIETALGRPPASVSLFDLPLTPHPLWEIQEERIPREGREELFDVRLPSWEARSALQLPSLRQAFLAASEAILGLIGLPAGRFVLSQSVFARYSRLGFEAAMISAFGRSRFSRAFSPPAEGLRRTATVRFNEPFAAVAVTHAEPGPPIGAGGVDHGSVGPLWHALPVYAAWVAEPSDAEEITTDWDEESADAGSDGEGDVSPFRHPLISHPTPPRPPAAMRSAHDSPPGRRLPHPVAPRAWLRAVAGAGILALTLRSVVLWVEAEKEARILCGLSRPTTPAAEIDRLFGTANLLRVAGDTVGSRVTLRVSSPRNLGLSGCTLSLQDGAVVRRTDREYLRLTPLAGLVASLLMAVLAVSQARRALGRPPTTRGPLRLLPDWPRGVHGAAATMLAAGVASVGAVLGVYTVAPLTLVAEGVIGLLTLLFLVSGFAALVAARPRGRWLVAGTALVLSCAGVVLLLGG